MLAFVTGCLNPQYLTWQMQWKSMDAWCLLQRGRSLLQRPLVYGEGLFTRHSPTCQRSCPSGTAEAHSPDITRASLCLRCVSARCLHPFSHCTQSLNCIFTYLVCRAPFNIFQFDVKPVMCIVLLLNKSVVHQSFLPFVFAFSHIGFWLFKNKNLWNAYTSDKLTSLLNITSFTYFVTLLYMTRRKMIMLGETNHTLCWMFPQIQSVAPPSSYEVKFHKCAQVRHTIV